jgi:hypothetical protein
MEIQTRQLEIIFQKIISKLKEDGIDRVELNQDMYLFLSNRDSYEMNQVVEKPLIGSLVDDWEELKKISEDKQIMTYVDFERLSSILRAVCEELSPEE